MRLLQGEDCRLLPVAAPWQVVTLFSGAFGNCETKPTSLGRAGRLVVGWSFGAQGLRFFELLDRAVIGSFDACHVAAKALEVGVAGIEADDRVGAAAAEIELLGFQSARTLQAPESLGDFFDEHRFGGIRRLDKNRSDPGVEIRRPAGPLR